MTLGDPVPENTRPQPDPKARCFGRIVFATYGGMRIDRQCHECLRRRAAIQDVKGWAGRMRQPITMPHVGEDGVCVNRVEA